MTGCATAQGGSDGLASTPTSDKQPGSDTKPDKAAAAPDPKPSASGDQKNVQSRSLLTPAQRTTLEEKFRLRALAIEGNYQDAASQLRVNELLKKEDSELHWIASLLLDVGVGLVAGQILKSLVAIKASRGAKLEAIVSSAIEHQEPNFKLTTSQQLIQAATKLSDESVKSTVDAAFGLGKKQAITDIKEPHIAGIKDEKEQNVAFLDYLKDVATITYQRFRESGYKGLDDAELILLFDSLDGHNHLISFYKVLISDKLKRFQDSKVSEIGRKLTTRKLYAADGKQVATPGYAGKRVMRDVYVEWHTYLSSSPNQLVYRFHDSHDLADSISPDEPSETALPMPPSSRKKVTASPEHGVSEDPNSIFIVPREFHEIAIERHRKMWGQDPHYEFVDDSNFPDPIRAKSARDNRARQATSKQSKASTKTSAASAAPPKPSPLPPADVFNGVDVSSGKKRGQP